MIMHNFTEIIIAHVITEHKSRKYAYHSNFSTVVHICLQYFLRTISPPTVETSIARLILSFQLGRSLPHNLPPKIGTSFYYRVAQILIKEYFFS